jgi:hypothetical protein
MTNRRQRLGWLALAALAGAALAAPTFTAAANPAGNNGTIKVDRLPFDTSPNNEPHVGCRFQVDWYGYDKGALNSKVTFTVHPPSGRDVDILTDTVFMGEDDNSGGGSERGLDAQRTYNLQGLLSAFKEHPKQGYHVKLTINADGSQGADTKHKVFWVKGCAPIPT